MMEIKLNIPQYTAEKGIQYQWEYGFDIETKVENGVINIIANKEGHSLFGKFYKSASDGLWWSVDDAIHAGSRFKVFKETAKGLEWIADADEFGDFIIGKHKGEIGKFIPWKELF